MLCRMLDLFIADSWWLFMIMTKHLSLLGHRMTRIFPILLFIGLAWGQNELLGIYYNNKYQHSGKLIYKTKSGQFIDDVNIKVDRSKKKAIVSTYRARMPELSKYDDDEILGSVLKKFPEYRYSEPEKLIIESERTEELIDPWVGDSYTFSIGYDKNAGKKIKFYQYLKVIDENQILYGIDNYTVIQRGNFSIVNGRLIER